MEKEKELTPENSTDIFICTSCKKKTTRGEIRKKWNQIPFCREESKKYYC